jgi:hypothetical protein
MKWICPLERFLEIIVAVWMFDIFFHRPASPAVGQKGPSQREWATPEV